MSDLILSIGENIEQAWDWLAVDGHGCANDSEEKRALCSQNFSRLVVIIPGMHVVTKLHTLENLSASQKQQAVGYSLEDELASSIESVHIAFDPRATRLAIAAKHIVSDILEALGTVGLFPDIICADYDALNGDGVIVSQGRVIKSASNGLGFTTDEGLAEHVMDSLQSLPEAIPPTQFLQHVSDSFKSGHEPINLRQGLFAKRTGLAKGRVKRSVFLGVACVLAFCALYIGQGLLYAQKTKAVKTEIRDIYVSLFPDTAIPANPTLAVLRAGADQNAYVGDEFINLSSILAASLKRVEGTEITSLGYDKGRGQLSLSVVYNSFDDVEQLKSIVAEYGGVFTENGTRQTESGLTGDAVLRAAP